MNWCHIKSWCATLVLISNFFSLSPVSLLAQVTSQRLINRIQYQILDPYFIIFFPFHLNLPPHDRNVIWENFVQGLCPIYNSIFILPFYFSPKRTVFLLPNWSDFILYIPGSTPSFLTKISLHKLHIIY